MERQKEIESAKMYEESLNPESKTISKRSTKQQYQKQQKQQRGFKKLKKPKYQEEQPLLQQPIQVKPAIIYPSQQQVIPNKQDRDEEDQNQNNSGQVNNSSDGLNLSYDRNRELNNSREKGQSIPIQKQKQPNNIFDPQDLNDMLNPPIVQVKPQHQEEQIPQQHLVQQEDKKKSKRDKLYYTAIGAAAVVAGIAATKAISGKNIISQETIKPLANKITNSVKNSAKLSSSLKNSSTSNSTIKNKITGFVKDNALSTGLGIAFKTGADVLVEEKSSREALQSNLKNGVKTAVCSSIGAKIGSFVPYGGTVVGSYLGAMGSQMVTKENYNKGKQKVKQYYEAVKQKPLKQHYESAKQKTREYYENTKQYYESTKQKAKQYYEGAKQKTKQKSKGLLSMFHRKKQ